MGYLSTPVEKINYWGIVQRSELLTVNQRIMVRVHVPQLLKSNIMNKREIMFC